MTTPKKKRILDPSIPDGERWVTIRVRAYVRHMLRHIRVNKDLKTLDEGILFLVDRYGQAHGIPAPLAAEAHRLLGNPVKRGP